MIFATAISRALNAQPAPRADGLIERHSHDQLRLIILYAHPFTHAGTHFPVNR